MSNTYCLINCEGNIFVIYFKYKKIIAEVLLDDGSGKISFEINKFSIIKYLHNEITLNDLLKKSPSNTIEFFDYTTKSISQINKKQVGKLSCGNDRYNNLPLEMKLPFDKRIELSVRANYIALDFKKIMLLVKDYFYLKEKDDLLNLTFRENSLIKERCKKQLYDVRHYLLEMEIPFEFASFEEIQRLGIEQVCLKKECGLDLLKIGQKIGQKDISNVTNKEMNYLVYRLSALIADLNQSPRFWTKKAKNKYIHEYKDHYYPFMRNIVIDDILK